MVTYAQLWEVDPAAWRAVGAAWRGLVAMVERRRAALVTVAGGLGSVWKSAAGAAAAGHVTRLGDPLLAARAAFLEVDQVLAGHAATLVRARAALAAVSALTEIDRHGRVTPPDGGLQARVDGALRLADAADRSAAARLAALSAEAARGWPAVAPLVRPVPGASPATVKRWWDGLTLAERRWLVTHEPGIGRLDGVPVAARDQANRLLLPAQRAALLALRDATAEVRLPRAATAVELRRIARLLNGFDAVTARLDAAPRAYLLGLDPTGDGRAVVAMGDPDVADNVVTLVPGMLADLGGVEGWLDRAERVAIRGAALDAGQETAAVLWLDYDAPDFLDDAAQLASARAAAPALHDHVAGLRATHEGPPAYQTVVGHSYGAVVIGVTARDTGLAADSVAFLGPPGVGAETAAQLGVPTVWSSTSADDVIRHAVSIERLAARMTLGISGVPGIVARSLIDDDGLWHGTDPSGDSFGARVFASDRHGHGGYWDTDNVALDNLARIALGPEQHDAVTRP